MPGIPLTPEVPNQIMVDSGEELPAAFSEAALPFASGEAVVPTENATDTCTIQKSAQPGTAFSFFTESKNSENRGKRPESAGHFKHFGTIKYTFINVHFRSYA